MEEERKVVNLPIDDVLPNRFQPRIKFNEQAINELAESIKLYGVIQPIVVRKIGDKYEIIAGERRYKASIIAGKTTIPALITSLSDKDSTEIALIENVQRQDLTPIEEAISYKKILDMGYINQQDLGSKLGKTQSTIANKLRLLNLSDEVQEALLENKISERHARSLLKLNEKDQVMMLNRIINERLTVRKTDEEIQKLLDGNSDGDDGSQKVKENEKGDMQMNNDILKDFNIPTEPIVNETDAEELVFDEQSTGADQSPDQVETVSPLEQVSVMNETPSFEQQNTVTNSETKSEPIQPAPLFNPFASSTESTISQTADVNVEKPSTEAETQSQINNEASISTDTKEVTPIFNPFAPSVEPTNNEPIMSQDIPSVEPVVQTPVNTEIPTSNVEPTPVVNTFEVPTMNVQQPTMIQPEIPIVNSQPEQQSQVIQQPENISSNLQSEPTSAMAQPEVPTMNVEPEVQPVEMQQPDLDAPRGGKFFNFNMFDNKDENYVSDVESAATNMDFGNQQPIMAQPEPIQPILINDTVEPTVQQPINPIPNIVNNPIPNSTQNIEMSPMNSQSAPFTEPAQSFSLSDENEFNPNIQSANMVPENKVSYMMDSNVRFDDDGELEVKLPEQNISNITVDMKGVINTIRDCASQIESFGYRIETEEIDLENSYEVTFKIAKNN